MTVSEKLVEQAVRGDRDALAALVAEVQADVWRLMLSQLRNTADAEDATQETFRQAVASIRDLREPRAFAGWLYRIALDKAREARFACCGRKNSGHPRRAGLHNGRRTDEPDRNDGDEKPGA